MKKSMTAVRTNITADSVQSFIDGDFRPFDMLVDECQAEYIARKHNDLGLSLIAERNILVNAVSALQSLVNIYDDKSGRQWTTSTKRRALDEAHEAIKQALGEIE